MGKLKKAFLTGLIAAASAQGVTAQTTHMGMTTAEKRTETKAKLALNDLVFAKMQQAEFNYLKSKGFSDLKASKTVQKDISNCNNNESTYVATMAKLIPIKFRSVPLPRPSANRTGFAQGD